MDAVLTKVTIATPVLQDLVARAVKGSTMVEVIPLSCYMQVKIKDNKLTVRSTDNINFLTTFANVTAPDFEVVVPSKLFAQTISKLSTATTSISVENGVVIIEANGKYDIAMATDADGSAISYPEPSIEAVGTKHHVTTEQIKSVLSLNKSCKAEMKEVPAIYNYYMDNERVLTTNMFKGCINPISMFDTPVCIPPNLLDLVPLVCDEDGVDIVQSADSVLFSSSKGELYGKKCIESEVDGFPAQALVDVFSTDILRSCKVNRTMLISAVDRLSLFTDALQSNKLTLSFSKESVTLKSTISSSFESVNYINALSDDFEDVVFDIDAIFLKSELTACDREDITIKFSAENGLQIVCDTVTLALSILDDEE